MLNIDVLGSGVGNWLLGQENGALVISSRKDGMVAFEMLSLPPQAVSRQRIFF